MREMLGRKKCCFYWGDPGFPNLLAGFAEVSEAVPQQGITDKAHPASQKWHFAPSTLGSQTVGDKGLELSHGAAPVWRAV